MNEVRIRGKIGTPPASKYTPGGMHVVEFRFCHSTRKTNADGSFSYDNHWFNVSCFKEVADYAVQLKKGMVIDIVGRLKVQTWVDKNTNANREKVMIIANEIYIYSGLQKPAQQQVEAKATQYPAQESLAPTFSDDDIPF